MKTSGDCLRVKHNPFGSSDDLNIQKKTCGPLPGISASVQIIIRRPTKHDCIIKYIIFGAHWGTGITNTLSRLAASGVFLKNLAQLHPSFGAKKSKMSQVPKQSLSLFN